MIVFCNFLEIMAETKKVVGVNVDQFGVLYSYVKLRRLYIQYTEKNNIRNTNDTMSLSRFN